MRGNNHSKSRLKLKKKQNHSQSIFLIRSSFTHRNSRQEQQDEGGKQRRENRHPFDTADHVQGDHKHAPPQDDLAKVVGVSGQVPQTVIADLAVVQGTRPEGELEHIRIRLHQKAEQKEPCAHLGLNKN